MDAKTPLGTEDLSETLRRIAEALERLSPRPPATARSRRRRRLRVASGRAPARAGPQGQSGRHGLLRGIDRVRDVLMDNTERFARGLPANNALLWGARGMGKSSLVKASHASINAQRGKAASLKLIEIHREDIESLPELMTLLRGVPRAGDRVLRRSLVRRRRHHLQVAQGGARRRHRGPPRQRHLLRDLQPPPPDAARDDGERALDRDQSGRGGRGEGLAVGPLRPLARLPPLQPGRIPRHGAGLRRAITASRPIRRRCAPRRSNGRPRAARARVAWRGSTCRTSRGGSASRWRNPPPLADQALEVIRKGRSRLVVGRATPRRNQPRPALTHP